MSRVIQGYNDDDHNDGDRNRDQTEAPKHGADGRGGDADHGGRSPSAENNY